MKIKSKISDAVNPDQFRQVSETKYVFQKDGQDAYTLNKKDKHWECSCPAYKFHKKCKHSQWLEEQLKPEDEEKPKRHPRAEMEKFIPELTEICSPFETWCLADDVVLFSRKGPIKVADLKSGMEIWDGEKFSKATVVMRKRVPTYKVTFASGHKIECSRDHKFLAKGWKGVQVFREVTASKNTQFVFSQTAIEFETEEFVQEAPAKFSSGIKQLNLNNLDKRELAYWIGRCLGDGTISNKEQQENGNFFVRMAFGKNELAEAERYQTFLKSLGLQVDIAETETALSVDVFCKNLQKLFEFYGMTDGRAATKRLGSGCYNFSVPERLSLIDGYVDADGYLSKGSAIISSVSLQLLEDVQQLCHSVGLTSSLRGPYRGGNRIICDIECSTKPEYRLYIRKHGMTTKVREIVESTNYVTTISIDDQKHQYYSGGLISKNCIVGSWRRKCFAKGTLVRTFYGKKPIEEIQVGDIVFNGEGNLTKVTDVVSYPTNKWVRVNYRRDSSIVCTPDHQFLIWKSNSPRKAYEWEPADNMNHPHWKMITPKLNLPEDLSIGWIYAFLLGWYLADGNMCWQKDKTNARFPYKGGGIYHVTLAADSMRVTELLHLIADLGFRNFTFNSNEENNSLLITIRDRKLIEFLLKWGGIHCPPLGEDKFGNFDILRLKKEEKKAFVQGFWLGAGSYGKYNNAESVRIYNSNKEMIEILDNILSEDYRTLRYVDCRADKSGGKYKDLYEVRISADQANNFISTMEDVCADAKYLDKRINKFKRVIDADKQFPVFGQNIVSVDEFEEDGICYCISVEDGESFIADNFVVHNCSTFKDIDVIALASSEAWKQVHQNLVDSGTWEEFIFGPTLMRGMYHGYYLDFNLCPSEDDWLWWLIYRTGCLAKGTRVITPQGWRNIEDINPGDKVFDGEGNIVEVLDTRMSVVQDVTKIKFRNQIITTTTDHKFLVSGNGTQGAIAFHYTSPKWVPAEVLGRWSSLTFAMLKFPKQESPISKAEAFLLGLYLGDGNLNVRESCGKKSKQSEPYRIEIAEGFVAFDLRISLLRTHKDQYFELFDSYGIAVHSYSEGRGNEATIIIKDKRLAQVCFDYGGVTSKKLNKTKFLSEEVLYWPWEIQREILRGFFLADGTVTKGGGVQLINSNGDVLDKLWLICKQRYPVYNRSLRKAKLCKSGWSLPMQYFTILGECAAKIIRENQDIIVCKDAAFRITDDKEHYNVDGSTFKCLCSKPITICETTVVYDLQVDSRSHSFLIEQGMIVHNSQDENVALRKRAIQMGYAISEKGVQDRFTFEYVDGINTEADFYHFLGLEYRKPEERDGQNFKELKGWKMEEHLSPGKQAMDQGDFDWHDYIIASIDKLKDRTTVYRSAKYPARLAILVAREIARRVNQPVEAILKNVTPEEIQPEGFKKGQQTWDKDGNIITVK